MSLPPELEQCLNKHVQHVLKRMTPDGVFLYLSGARLVNDDDNKQYHLTADVYDKNHAILKIVSRHGRRGFDAFMEALETTQQDGIVEKLRATLDEKYNNELISVDGQEKIKNCVGNQEIQPVVGSTSRRSSADDVLMRSSGSSPMRRCSYGAMPTPRLRASVSPSLTRSRSVSRATPLTPPLTEEELDEHLNRLKSLLHKISSQHGDRFCRQEAAELLGEMEDAGDAMIERVRQLSEENAEKERELRRAKYMVRGMETEITRLKAMSPTVSPTEAPPTTSTTLPTTPTCQISEERKSGVVKKSKLCVIL